MSKTFGSYIRERRSELQSEGPDFSVRRLARRIGVEPSYLSKVERDETPPPSEAKIVALSAMSQLNENWVEDGDLFRKVLTNTGLRARLQEDFADDFIEPDGKMPAFPVENDVQGQITN